MNSQIDMDKIKISAQMWHTDFMTRFYQNWFAGLEDIEPEPQENLWPGAEEDQELLQYGGLENA